MKRKSTDELNSELMEENGLDAYINENRPFFVDQNVTELLTALYEKKRISKAALARRSCMSEVYLHQVFSGRRKPSRDRLLCLCIGLEATMEETQELLRQSSYAQLYTRHKRDAIISYGVLHHLPLAELNDKLFAEDEKILF